MIGYYLEKQGSDIQMTPKYAFLLFESIDQLPNRRFSVVAHVGTVKSIACGLSHNTPYCVTGGADESIRYTIAR